MGKKCDLSEFDHGAKTGCLNISESADFQGFSHRTVFKLENSAKNKKTSSEQQFYRQKLLVNVRKVSGERPDWSKLTGM